ncbi:MAG TPA: phage protein NinX family protein [Terriglobales bacterium]
MTNVSFLTGVALDRWVARAAGIEVFCFAEGMPHEWIGKDVQGAREIYSPSTDWSQAGPLIEIEQRSIERANGHAGEPLKYYARAGTGHRRTRSLFGSTHLIAAMRAYVTCKLGDSVVEDPSV